MTTSVSTQCGNDGKKNGANPFYEKKADGSIPPAYDLNMSKQWFKAKRYGYGWTPCSWEGWLVTLTFVVLAVLPAVSQAWLDLATWSVIGMLFTLAWYAGLVTLLIRICSTKGEPARWRWGA